MTAMNTTNDAASDNADDLPPHNDELAAAATERHVPTKTNQQCSNIDCYNTTARQRALVFSTFPERWQQAFREDCF